MKNNSTLSEAKRLYDFGFGILWIHPGQKRPIESKWTTGERSKWSYLAETYIEGLNVGVRTGEASKIGKHYLAVIDVDIKDASFKTQALEKVKELIGDNKCPMVLSGSGNGSRHYYCVTASPFKMKTILKTELGEICVYSSGRQMVIPPSKTKNFYTWKNHIKSAADIPLLEFPESMSQERVRSEQRSNASKRSEAIVVHDFKVATVDLDWLPIPEKIKEGIVYGTGVSDRSGFLLYASSALLSAGLSTDEVLSVLTDTRYFIGDVGFDHAKTKDRKRAAEWIYKYSFKKVENERDAASVFIRPPKPGESMTPEEMEEMAKEFADPYSKGFYKRGAKGAYIPDYELLLKHFDSESPFKTIADMKSVYVYNGTHYKHLTPIEIKAFAENNFNPRPEEKIRVEFLNKVLANNVSTRDFFLGTTEGHVNFKNGVLDLNKDNTDLLPHSPDFGFRGVLPYNFDPEARCPIFHKWLLNVMVGDQNLVNILQEFMGYVIRGGEYKYHKALWLGGVGRNGKSTFVDLLKALIGAGNYSTISIKSLVSDKFSGADLDGKIANFSEETSSHELSDSGPFKNLTGDGDISAQKKYGDPFHFRNRAKLIMTYNQIPDLKDLSKGMLSRPVIIPFKKIIKESEQDRNIKKKLFSELSGIFNFALEGWNRLELQNEFSKSDASAEALTKIKDESCNVIQWAENYLDFMEPEENGRQFRPRDLYSAYCMKERFAYKSPEFFRRLNRHPKIEERRKIKNTGTIYFGLQIEH